jgi:[ribosomal protein S5]-alanine N-acetyltransferase
VRRLLAVFGSNAGDPRLTFETARLLIRPPRMEDFESWAVLRSASRAFLEPWEPIWPQDDLTRAAFKRRISRIEDEAAADMAYSFFLFTRDDARLVGGANLNNVRRRAAQMATLGYWMGAPFAGQGLMTEAVGAVVPFAFRLLKLERIEAACIPENLASVRVLEKTGFRREGLAREYLAIAGQRRDHLLFARLASDAASEFSSASSPQFAR